MENINTPKTSEFGFLNTFLISLMYSVCLLLDIDFIGDSVFLSDVLSDLDSLLWYHLCDCILFCS